jgi:hypothetical protein
MLVSMKFIPESKIAPIANSPLLVESDPSSRIIGATRRTVSPTFVLSFFARLTPIARPAAGAVGVGPLVGYVRARFASSPLTR